MWPWPTAELVIVTVSLIGAITTSGRYWKWHHWLTTAAMLDWLIAPVGSHPAAVLIVWKIPEATFPPQQVTSSAPSSPGVIVAEV